MALKSVKPKLSGHNMSLVGHFCNVDAFGKSVRIIRYVFPEIVNQSSLFREQYVQIPCNR